MCEDPGGVLGQDSGVQNSGSAFLGPEGRVSHVITLGEMDAFYFNELVGSSWCGNFNFSGGGDLAVWQCQGEVSTGDALQVKQDILSVWNFINKA